MMSYIFQAIIVVGFLGLLFFFAGNALKDGGLFYIIGAITMIVLLIAGILYASAEEEKQGPCIKEETSWQYNAATKTSMPYKHCVERGTWVNP